MSTTTKRIKNRAEADTSIEKPDRLFVESLARGFRVLEAFAEAPTPMSLSQIAKAAGLDKSAAQRLTYTLAKLGYVEKTAGGLVPGRRLLERSFDYLRTTPLVNRAIPILADLRRAVQERVDLSLFDDLSMLYLVRMQSKRDTFYAHLVGRRVPTFCTSGGRAVLSHLPEDRVLDILERSDRRKITPRTTTEISEILERLAEVRETGYSLAIEEVLIGEVAIGVAVLDNKGAPIAAIHVAGSLAEWKPEEFVQRVGPLVIAAANGLRG
ncbi:IclR family transcriptional regulator [Rhodoligotrophos ferricapiens]|uniref:IclR family transcriptional regulator n=1 Tax=Rhodoligotrophos ferricapiens TaxID=3069264 RepID=UPI00315CF37E